MKFNLFKKKKNKKSNTVGKTEPVVSDVPAVSTEEETLSGNVSVPKLNHPIAHVIKHLYISEKSTYMGKFNQYVFKVVPSATKNEVAKEVNARYNVKIKRVNILNLPGKIRNVGRHSGFRSGYRKAIVALEPGYVIEQAKP